MLLRNADVILNVVIGCFAYTNVSNSSMHEKIVTFLIEVMSNIVYL